jgi:hypothetical protein
MTRPEVCSGKGGATAPQPRDGRLAVDLFHRHGISPDSAAPQPRRRVECNSTIPGGGSGAGSGRRGAAALRPRDGRLAADLFHRHGISPIPPHRNLGGGSSATRPSRGRRGRKRRRCRLGQRVTSSITHRLARFRCGRPHRSLTRGTPPARTDPPHLHHPVGPTRRAGTIRVPAPARPFIRRSSASEGRGVRAAFNDLP